MKRKPSPARLVKGLEALAHEAETKAAKLRDLGFEDHARAVSAAAQALMSAAFAVSEKQA